MKIVKILGGLGNQMFQYALFLSLKERFPHEQVMIDTSCFRNYPLHNGFEVDRIFAQKAPVASWRNILKVAYPYPNYRFWKIGKYILPNSFLHVAKIFLMLPITVIVTVSFTC